MGKGATRRAHHLFMTTNEWWARFALPTLRDLRQRRLRRLLLRADQLAVDQDFRDLDRIQCGALAKIVRDAPQHETVLHRGVLADAADVGGVLAGRFVRRGVAAGLMLVDDETAGRLAQNVARFVRGDRVLELDV